MESQQVLSQNQREGSLYEVSLGTVLETCRQHRFTGTISIHTADDSGELELNAGVVDAARFGEAQGDPAVASMCQLRNGQYRLSQRLPRLDGSMGPSAALEARSQELPLVGIMRHCEENALTCTVIVTHGEDRGEIKYCLGEIIDVTLNGERDEDAIVALVHLPKAQYKVVARPLDPSLHGWPTADGSEPFGLALKPRMRTRPLRAMGIGLLLGATGLAAVAALAPQWLDLADRWLRYWILR